MTSWHLESSVKQTVNYTLLLLLFAIGAYAQEDHDHEGHDHSHDDEAIESHAGHSHGPSSAEECYAQNVNYALNMRIGAIFIVLAATALGVFSPIILYRIRPLPQNGFRYWMLTIGKFFGTGVILATAFVHMLPEAIDRFQSPCLSEGWHEYHGFAGVFALLAVFLIQIVELAVLSHVDRRYLKERQDQAEHKDVETQKETSHVHSAGLLEEKVSVRNIGTIILEFGIIMHSIIIGITLGTITGDGFTTLLIALVFHQFFEGIALGTRINDMDHKSWAKPLIMGFLFCITTPVGVAIGIGIHRNLNPYSESSMVAQGILDSLSGGILLYNAFISLIASEINQSLGFRQSSLAYKLVCLISMYIGAALMSVLGTWA